MSDFWGDPFAELRPSRKAPRKAAKAPRKVSPRKQRLHESRLQAFVEWCVEQGFERQSASAPFEIARLRRPDTSPMRDPVQIYWPYRPVRSYILLVGGPEAERLVREFAREIGADADGPQSD